MRPIMRLLALALSASLVFSAAPAGAAEIIRSISFAADSSTGYMGGVSTSPMGSKGFISVTRNGGSSWAAQWLPSFNDIVSVAAGSGQNALAVGSFNKRPWQTANWGAGWTAMPQPGVSGANMNLGGVERFSGGRIVVVGTYDGAEGSAYGKYGVIAMSNDSGVNWNKRFYGPVYQPAGEDPAVPTNADMRDVDTFGAGTYGWAVGNERNPGTGGDSATYKRILIFKTSDGGQSWVQQSSPVVLNGLSMKSVVAVSANVAYMVGTSGVVLYTTDGGSTWTSKVLAGKSLNGVDAVNDKTVVAVGDQGWVATTTDGGANWTTKQVSGRQRLNSVSVVTRTTWIAVGDGNAVYKTTNAGGTWAALSGAAPPPPPATQSGVSTAFTSTSGSKSGLAYGAKTAIYSTLRTTSGGSVGIQLVQLQRSNNGKTGWSTVATADTNASGYVAFSIPAWKSGYNYSKAYFRLVFGGAAGYKGITSAVRSVDPKAYLGKPYTSTTKVKAKKTYTWRVQLKPRHTAGTKPVKLRFERKVNGKWRFYKNVYATAYNSSTYSRVKASYKLPKTGKWRVRAFHDDAGHYPTYSSWLYVTAK